MSLFSWDHPTLRRNAIMALGLLTIVLVVHEIFGPHGYIAMRRQRQEHQALERRIRNLQRENAQLKRQIQALQSNPQAIEKLAREQMHFARPGEIIYALPKRDPKHAPASATQKPQPPQP
jgi:cell division protein FtsB